ncbi:hypothetical protein LB505_001083 [Fusarium chuoi]|nr:hypothetical protein LB505_001083 [Fusarium chuoi]
MTEAEHMPPTCCTDAHIGLEHVDKLFDSTFKRIWNKKFVEYSLRNRLYCPSRRCGEWIRPADIYRDRETGRKAARCDQCNTKVALCEQVSQGRRDGELSGVCQSRGAEEML